jgi:hypothetical protein
MLVCKHTEQKTRPVRYFFPSFLFRQFSYLVLAGYEILRLGRVGWVDVPHPIGLGDVTTVYVIVQFVVLVNLDASKSKIFIFPVF